MPSPITARLLEADPCTRTLVAEAASERSSQLTPLARFFKTLLPAQAEAFAHYQQLWFAYRADGFDNAWTATAISVLAELPRGLNVATDAPHHDACVRLAQALSRLSL